MSSLTERLKLISLDCWAGRRTPSMSFLSSLLSSPSIPPSSFQHHYYLFLFSFNVILFYFFCYSSITLRFYLLLPYISSSSASISKKVHALTAIPTAFDSRTQWAKCSSIGTIRKSLSLSLSSNIISLPLFVLPHSLCCFSLLRLILSIENQAEWYAQV